MAPADSMGRLTYHQICELSAELLVCAAASVARMSSGARANLVEKVEEMTQKAQSGGLCQDLLPILRTGRSHDRSQ